MTTHAEFTTYFFQVESSVPFKTTLAHLSKMTATQRTLKYGANGHLRAENFSAHKGFTVVDLVRLRDGDRPTKGTLEADGTSPIALEENEHVCEETALIYEPIRNVIALQRNHFGVGTLGIESYLRELFPAVSFTFKPVAEKSWLRRLRRFEVIRSVRIGLATVRASALKDKDAAVGRVLAVAHDMKAPQIYVEMKMGHAGGGLTGPFEFLKVFKKIHDDTDSGAVTLLRARGIDPDLKRMTELDLLEPLLQQRVRISLSGGTATIESRVQGLLDAWLAATESLAVLPKEEAHNH